MKNFFITLIALLLTINFVSYSQENKTGKIVPRLTENVDSEKMNQWADSVFDKLTLDEKVKISNGSRRLA